MPRKRKRTEDWDLKFCIPNALIDGRSADKVVHVRHEIDKGGRKQLQHKHPGLFGCKESSQGSSNAVNRTNGRESVPVVLGQCDNGDGRGYKNDSSDFEEDSEVGMRDAAEFDDLNGDEEVRSRGDDADFGDDEEVSSGGDDANFDEDEVSSGEENVEHFEEHHEPGNGDGDEVGGADGQNWGNIEEEEDLVGGAGDDNGGGVDGSGLSVHRQFAMLAAGGVQGNFIALSHDWSDLENDYVPEPRPDDVLNVLLPDQDVDSALKISQQVWRIHGNSSLKFMRLLDQNQTMSNTLVSNLLKLIHSVEPGDKKELPTHHRGLLKCIPLQSLSCWISHMCFECKISTIYRFHLGMRSVIPFPRCHKILNYNEDHYLVTDLAETLALLMPSIWQWRNRKYLPPHMEKVMTENNMDFNKDLTLTISSDGVQFFKSSSLSLWPVLAFVDGIPYHIQRKSIVFLGALAAKNAGKYVQLMSMIEDVVRQVKRLNSEGFSWMYEGKIITSRVLLSRVVADSPARADLQGIMKHNGKFGCNFCMHASNGHYYLHLTNPSTPRTDEKIRTIYAKEDFHSQTVYDRDGIRWKSPFALLPFDMIDGFPPDSMHAVHLGVMKLLIGYWLSKAEQDDEDYGKKPKRKRKAFQLTTSQVAKVNNRLLHTLPPVRTSRRPRELSKFRMWKAHELSMFLLYYGPVVLEDVLPRNFYDHYIELVAGISLLSQKITADAVDRAQEHLEKFSATMGKLYPRKCMRYNVHLLRHLPRACKLHGILPLFSMYPFESENHTLGKFVNQCQGIVLQMYQKSMRRLILNSHKDAFKKEIRERGWLEGKCPYEYMDFTNIQDMEPREPDTSYYQIYNPPRGRPKFISKAYTALKQRKSYFVMLENGNVACILKFYKGWFTKQIVAIVEEYHVSRHSVLGHIWFLKNNLGMRVVPVASFVETVVEVHREGRTGYGVYLNNIEHVAD